jgi:hypothetical protein
MRNSQAKGNASNVACDFVASALYVLGTFIQHLSSELEWHVVLPLETMAL